MLSYEQFKAYMDSWMKEQEEKWPSDLHKADWDAAKDAGIFDGTMPQAPLTREQASTVLKRVGLVGRKEA